MVSLRTRVTQALLLAACVAPAQARADAELKLGLETAAEYDDNVLVQSGNPTSDFIGRLGPRLELRDTRGELQYEVRYFPSYEKFLDLSDLDGWNHDALVNFTWQAGERTLLRFRDQYIDSNRAVSALESGEPIDPTGEAASILGRRGFTQNLANAELLHRLTQVDELSLTARNVLTEDDPFQDLTVTESDVTTFGLSWLRTLSGRNQAGLFVRYTRQDFQDLTLSNETRSDFYNASFQWLHRFDPTWTLSVSAGPAWVSSQLPENDVQFTDQPLYPVVQGEAARGPVLFDTCPTLADGTRVLSEECEVFPETRIFPGAAGEGFVGREDLGQTTDLDVIGDVPDGSSDGLTYFAALALTKEWQTLAATLRYSRDASTSASAAGNVRDIVQGSLNWRVTERLKVGFVASWEQREQATTGVVFDQRALSPATAAVISPPGEVTIGQSAGIIPREIDRSVNNERYTLALNVQYNLTRRTTLFARLFWIDQEVDDDAFGVRTSDRFNAVLGVRYYFDPIQLPI